MIARTSSAIRGLVPAAVALCLLAAATARADAQDDMEQWCADHAQDCARIEAAFEFANGIEVANFRIQAILDIAVALSDIGLAGPARHNFQVAIDNAVQSYDRLDAQARGVIRTGLALAEAGWQSDSNEVLGLVYDIAAQERSDNRRSVILMELAEAEAQRGRWEAATAAANTVPADNQRRDEAIGEIALRQAEAGDLDAARASAQTIVTDGRRGEALADLAPFFTAAGDRGTAAELVVAAEQVASTVENEFQRTTVLRAVVAAQIAAGDLAAARATADAISDNAGRVSALADIALADAAAGNRAEARATLSDARAIAETDDGVGREMGLAEVAATLAFIGLADEAMAIAGLIERERGYEFALAEASMQARDAADWEGALGLLRDIADDRLRLSVAASVARSRYEAGETAEATAMLADLVDAAAGIPDRADREDALAAIAVAQAETGDIEAARATLNGVLAEASLAEGLLAIVRTHLAAGNLPTAAAVADEITHRYIRSEAAALLVAAYAGAAAEGSGEEPVQ